MKDEDTLDAVANALESLTKRIALTRERETLYLKSQARLKEIDDELLKHSDRITQSVKVILASTVVAEVIAAEVLK